MRFVAGCVIAMLLPASLSSLKAEEPANRELSEIKQVLVELTARLEQFERKANHEQVPDAEQQAETDEAEPLVTRVYRVQDLITAPADFRSSDGPFARFDPLIRYLTAKVAPKQWETTCGRGTVRQYDQNLSLVIAQTEEVHEQIEQELARLREAKKLLSEIGQIPPQRAGES